MIPTDTQLAKDCAFLGYNEANTARILEAARCARTGTTVRDGWPSGSGGGRPSGISDPTGTAATTVALRDEVGEQYALLFDMFLQELSSKRAVLNTLDRLDGMRKPDRGPGQTSKACCTEGCDGEATRRGRCDACRKWQERNQYPDGTRPEVPGEVVAERTKRREKVNP